MNYEDMNDAQINKTIATKLAAAMYDGSGFNDLFAQLELSANRDYCSDPAAAWPIIVNEQIDLLFDKYSGDGCTAIGTSSKLDEYGCSTLECTDSNPLRAAMIVYLKMKESGDE